MGRLFMTGEAVVNFIKHFALGRETLQDSSQILLDLLRQMRELRSQALAAERQFYGKLGYNGLRELQQRLDNCNTNQALRNLQNVSIRQTEWGQMAQQGGITTAQLIKELKTVLVNNNQINNEVLFQNMINDIVNYFNEDSDTRGTRARANTKNINGQSLINAKKLKDDLLDSLLKGKKFSKTYAADLKTYFKVKSIDGEAHLDQNITISIPSASEASFEGPVTSYPYFNLTPAGQQDALKNDILWNNFKNWLSKGDIDIIYCMDQIGRSVFIEQGDTFAHIIGILGELQAMAFLRKLTNSSNLDSSSLKHTALDLKNGKQINIDVLIEDFGFQIKNYQGYGRDESRGYHIHDELTWSQLEDTRRFGSNDTILNQIKQFYVTQVYNQPNISYKNTDTFAGYQSFYENFLDHKNGSINNSINAYLASNIDKLIPLQTVYDISLNDKKFSGTVFWIFGGQTIIPASALYSALIERLMDFIKAIKMGDKTAFNGFRVNTIGSYTGEIWPEISGYPVILKALEGLKFDFNIYLSSFKKYLDQSKVISKV